MSHFVLMYGMKGCLPLFCYPYETKSDAISSAIELLDIPPHGTIVSNLKRYGYSDCDVVGVEYIDVVPCDCNDINIHME